jgi:ankyrin repeat protein
MKAGFVDKNLLFKAIFNRDIEAISNLPDDDRHLVNEKNKDGDTPLHLAMRGKGNKKIVRLLLKYQCIDINAQSKDGDTPLHLAMRGKGNKKIVELLLEYQGIEINVKNKAGDTPLHLQQKRKIMRLECYYLNEKKLMFVFKIKRATRQRMCFWNHFYTNLKKMFKEKNFLRGC